MKTITSSLSVFAICAVAAPAFADVSAADIWAEWQARAAENGMPMSATATPTANGLSLSQLTWTGPSVPGEPDMVMTFSGLEMTELDDGSVVMTLPQPFQISFEGSQNGETLGRIVMDMITCLPRTIRVGARSELPPSGCRLPLTRAMLRPRWPTLAPSPR